MKYTSFSQTLKHNGSPHLSLDMLLVLIHFTGGNAQSPQERTRMK